MAYSEVETHWPRLKQIDQSWKQIDLRNKLTYIIYMCKELWLGFSNLIAWTYLFHHIFLHQWINWQAKRCPSHSRRLHALHCHYLQVSKWKNLDWNLFPTEWNVSFDKSSYKVKGMVKFIPVSKLGLWCQHLYYSQCVAAIGFPTELDNKLC